MMMRIKVMFGGDTRASPGERLRDASVARWMRLPRRRSEVNESKDDKREGERKREMSGILCSISTFYIASLEIHYNFDINHLKMLVLFPRCTVIPQCTAT